MNHSDIPLTESPRQRTKRRTVIWLGESDSALLQAAWPALDVFHVHAPEPCLRAVEQRLGDCLVVDLALPNLNPPSFLAQLQPHRPAVGLLALVDAPADAALTLPSGFDRGLSRHARPADLMAQVEALSSEAARRLDERQSVSERVDYDALQSRMRHLEGLAQATYSMSTILDTGDILLSDLREAARITVDADGMAVLLANKDGTDLSDELGLGVPEAYLAVCREYFHALDPDDRLPYLGEEVLLRGRLPGMLPSARRVREAEAVGAWSYMRLPLMIDQRLMGFVALFSQTPDQFDGAHLQLGRLFAAQVATAVRNMRLYYRLNWAEQRHNAVSQVARLIAEDLALDAVLSRIVEEAVRLVNGRQGTVLLLEPDESLVVSAICGPTLHTLGQKTLPGAGQAGQIALTGEPSVVTDYAAWDGALDEHRDTFPEDAILFGVPLTYRGRVLGVLQVAIKKSAVEDIAEKQDVLVMLAPQAATAIAKAQLHEIVYQERQQLQTILDHTAAAVVMCDAQGAILRLNPEAERVLDRLGLPVEDVRGHTMGEVLRKLVPAPSFAMPTLSEVIEVNLGEAGEYLVHTATITASDGSVERYVGVAQEVSELRRLDRLKSELIHILSHDLRNPLGLARGSVDLLDEPDIPPDQRDQLRYMIANSLDRMDQLIRDVVDLEMAESLGQQTVVPYHLNSLVQKVIRRYQHKAEQQQIALSYQEITAPPDRLTGHAVLVAQAVDNLVNNAIKYTPPGGRVEVTLTLAGETAVIKVVDTGFGIPAEYLPRLFKQFYRVPDKRTRHIQGTGLGLSLVRTVAQAHGGSVTVESQMEVGTTFTFLLPLQEPPQVAKANHVIPRLDLSDYLKPAPLPVSQSS